MAPRTPAAYVPRPPSPRHSSQTPATRPPIPFTDPVPAHAAQAEVESHWSVIQRRTRPLSKVEHRDPRGNALADLWHTDGAPVRIWTCATLRRARRVPHRSREVARRCRHPAIGLGSGAGTLRREDALPASWVTSRLAGRTLAREPALYARTHHHSTVQALR